MLKPVDGVPTELSFSDYQKWARQTAIYPPEHIVTYPLLGLVGEVGEFANKYKKVLRDGREFSKEDMESELGDILWYLTNVAFDAGLNINNIAVKNLLKLADRKNRGVLGGSGDNR